MYAAFEGGVRIAENVTNAEGISNDGTLTTHSLQNQVYREISNKQTSFFSSYASHGTDGGLCLDVCFTDDGSTSPSAGRSDVSDEEHSASHSSMI